jgi:hypothetical protein
MEMWQHRLHDPIQTLRVDLLHELEPLHRRLRHARPPDCPAVVDEHVDAAVVLHRAVDCGYDVILGAHVELQGKGIAASSGDFAGDGGDC